MSVTLENPNFERRRHWNHPANSQPNSPNVGPHEASSQRVLEPPRQLPTQLPERWTPRSQLTTRLGTTPPTPNPTPRTLDPTKPAHNASWNHPANSQPNSPNVGPHEASSQRVLEPPRQLPTQLPERWTPRSQLTTRLGTTPPTPNPTPRTLDPTKPAHNASWNHPANSQPNSPNVGPHEARPVPSPPHGIRASTTAATKMRGSINSNIQVFAACVVSCDGGPNELCEQGVRRACPAAWKQVGVLVLQAISRTSSANARLRDDLLTLRR